MGQQPKTNTDVEDLVRVKIRVMQKCQGLKKYQGIYDFWNMVSCSL